MLTRQSIFRSTGLISLLLVTAAVAFQTPKTQAAEKLSLRAALEKALQNNHEMAARKNSLAAQKEDIGIARSNLRPKLTLEERFLRTNNPTYAFMSKLNQERFSSQDFDITSLNDPVPVSDFQTTLTVFQPLLARQAAIGVDMSRTSYAAKTEEYYRQQETLVLQVARTYLMTQVAAEFIQVAEKGLEDAGEHLRIAKLSYNNGLGLYADTLRASTAVTEAEQKLVSAEKDLKVAQRSLGMLLGSDQAILTDSLDLDLGLHNLEHYIESVASRRDIQSMQHHFENARNSIELNEAGYIPTLGIGSSYQINDEELPFGSDGESWQVFALFKWELFDGSKRHHQKQKALYQAAEARELLAQLVEAAKFQVYESFLEVEEAQKNHDLAQSALTTAREGQRLVRLRYENSLSPLVDLLEAQVSLDQARTNALRRKKEQQLAILELSYHSGVIMPELGVEIQTGENN